MSYKKRIMSIPSATDVDYLRDHDSPQMGYFRGHIDARHAAAEIAAEADARLEVAQRMAEALRMLDAHYSASLDHQPAYVRAGRAALAEWEKQQ